MKLSEQWLRAWVNPPVDTHGLREQLTMAGLEVSASNPVGGEFSGVVVGLVLAVNPHPDAKRLHCCSVHIGQREPLAIVCGAQNVRPNLKVAVATVGAVLPGNIKIQQAQLRGVTSQGMICSAQELGLSKTSEEGILELPIDAPIGQSLYDYMQLPDQVFDIELTPNRADCLSIRGLAREVAAINGLPLSRQHIPATTATIDTIMDIKIEDSVQCPRYVGRIIQNINTKAQTPLWMIERLRRSGIRSVHPVVDITNYVMLEWGQPMHAFDLTKLQGGIYPRKAKAGECLELLDGRQIELQPGALVIADQTGPQALAGIMGGIASSVNQDTTHIFLESAYFDSKSISVTARHYGLQTDSSYRFARGVDFELPVIAMERATALILEIVGGEVGPINEALIDHHLPQPISIVLRKIRIKKLLGIDISDDDIEHILQALGMQLTLHEQGWQVAIPSYRFDIRLEVDLIEELARIYGYQHIPSQNLHAELLMPSYSEAKLPTLRLAQCLIEHGYQEAITYSFIDLSYHQLLNKDQQPIFLKNPISSDMEVMRTSLWPGLLQAVVYNLNRQVDRVRLFETGMCFLTQGVDADWQQIPMIGGVITGSVYPEQWGVSPHMVDFFDIKGDVEALLRVTQYGHGTVWHTSQHSGLHPGQQAALVYQGVTLGHIGAVHPTVLRALDISQPVYIFEFQLEALTQTRIPCFQPVSKFPAVRRDIAITLEQDIPVMHIKQYVEKVAGKQLRDLRIFDIYQGDKIAQGQKSVALGLVFQEMTHTLTDNEINDIMARILEKVAEQFDAKLRV